jgi:hypothetical protein
MSIETTRRSLLAAIPVAAIAAPVIPAMALGAEHPDAALIEAWERRSAAYKRYNLLPLSDEVGVPVGNYTQAEAAEWAIIDAAEEVIQSTVASTPEGVAIQLWAMLTHTVTHHDEERATLTRDLAFFNASDEDQDWTVRLILAAIRSLEGMGA